MNECLCTLDDLQRGRGSGAQGKGMGAQQDTATLTQQSRYGFRLAYGFALLHASVDRDR